MDDKVLKKLAILAKKDPEFAKKMQEQADMVSDDELEQVSGGDPCRLISCAFTSTCWDDSDNNALGRWESCTSDSLLEKNMCAQNAREEGRAKCHVNAPNMH